MYKKATKNKVKYNIIAIHVQLGFDPDQVLFAWHSLIRLPFVNIWPAEHVYTVTPP